MDRRQRFEATYDVMPAAAAELAYGDPLERRLAAAEGQAKLMARLLREAIGALRARPDGAAAQARRDEVTRLWRHRRKLQADARQHRLLIAQKALAERLWAAR